MKYNGCNHNSAFLHHQRNKICGNQIEPNKGVDLSCRRTCEDGWRWKLSFSGRCKQRQNAVFGGSKGRECLKSHAHFFTDATFKSCRNNTRCWIEKTATKYEENRWIYVRYSIYYCMVRNVAVIIRTSRHLTLFGRKQI